jgi:hypothetical protein
MTSDNDGTLDTVVVGDRYRAGKRLWTPADDATLCRRYPHEATELLARGLRRTVTSVYARAGVMGLRKSAQYLASPAACRLRRGDDVGARSRYPKGHVPANKGTRRPGWHRGRMQETQFRKGARPHTWRPVGTEVVDPDGYRKRKVADDRTRPSRFNWKFVHVLVWETTHGPVPPGHAVVFRNGDRADIRLANLELVTRRALMLRNTVHTFPKPLAETIQLLGALTRQIRRRTPHAEEERHRRSA